MNNFKKLSIRLFGPAIFMLALFLSPLAKAQTGAQAGARQMLANSTPEQRAQFQTNMMKTKLSLDTAQTAKIQAINLKYAQKTDPVMKSGKGKLAMYREVMTIQKDKDAEIKGVLTADQNKTYEEVKAEMKQKMMDYAQSKKAGGQ